MWYVICCLLKSADLDCNLVGYGNDNNNNVSLIISYIVCGLMYVWCIELLMYYWSILTYGTHHIEYTELINEWIWPMNVFIWTYLCIYSSGCTSSTVVRAWPSTSCIDKSLNIQEGLCWTSRSIEYGKFVTVRHVSVLYILSPR